MKILKFRTSEISSAGFSGQTHVAIAHFQHSVFSIVSHPARAMRYALGAPESGPVENRQTGPVATALF